MGNMYPKTKTWNPLGGECPHECEYCYRTDMMRFPHIKEKYTGSPRLCLSPPPKTDNVIFVCSMTDLFAKKVPDEMIIKILEETHKVLNTYLFQSKNPARFHDFMGQYPLKVIFGTTIETNRENMYQSNAPTIYDRFRAMIHLPAIKMVSIEPIMDFDKDSLVNSLRMISPSYISIGADSKNRGLPEPPEDKILALIEQLRIFTEVRLKSNLKRLVKQFPEVEG